MTIVKLSVATAVEASSEPTGDKLLIRTAVTTRSQVCSQSLNNSMSQGRHSVNPDYS